MASNNKKPLHTFKTGNARAAIFENDGKNGPFLKAIFSQSFRTETGEWRRSHSYTEKAIEDLMDAALEAKEWMASHKPAPAKA